ncbi:hypothetical protein EXIGLDRAFT_769095 [Exidia glandulosa HHB12029]|uniref:Uncharacterized protein n=1 Tax=Exidia glandulosa HHB12029 TaxID=1314781 RepID=A0A165HQX2_EXIGL|nr:hypothetical protein EXIGLDRAFT_769095 [Exidia glandulosa HHB12029]
MSCPHGAYVWETFVQSAVKIVPNVEVLEFPCAPELAAAGEEEHARPSLPLEVWKAPEAYAKHMTRLRQVNLGNGLSYVRTPKDDGFAFVCVDGEALDTPYLCLPAHLRHLVDDKP